MRIREYIDNYINEIERLENNFDENYEVILRYLVKANTILSNTDISTEDDLIYFITKMTKIRNKNLKTIINIYLSRIFYNRAEKLEKTLVLTNQDFSIKIPDFVDKTRLKIHLFEPDPDFKEKNIILPGGWLDLKNINSFNFND